MGMEKMMKLLRRFTAKERVFLAALLTVVLWGTPNPALAGNGKGVIEGTVTAKIGGAVDGAKVVAFNLDTGDVLQTHSDEQGHYQLTGLPKGDYELTVVAEGFDVYGSEEIKVPGKKPVRHDVELIELFQRSPQTMEK